VNIGGQEITLTAGTGATLQTIGDYTKVQNQYGGVWLYRRAANTYLAQGDLS
jgi:hypothetical protein